MRATNIPSVLERQRPIPSYVCLNIGNPSDPIYTYLAFELSKVLSRTLAIFCGAKPGGTTGRRAAAIATRPAEIAEETIVKERGYNQFSNIIVEMGLYI